MKKLGIIGGLGPMATAYFFQKIIEMTDAATDQEHIEIWIHNQPATPDRTDYILGKSTDNPLASIVESGRSLIQNGVDVLAMPCITAHYFHQELEAQIGANIIHGVRETASYLKDRNIKRVGIMATDATIEKSIFSKELEKNGIISVAPNTENQRKVMHLIYENVKAGNSIEMKLFEEVSKQLFLDGAEVILLGCTELSMVKKTQTIGFGFLDVVEVLAKSCVEQCGTLKKQYLELITKG